MAAIEPLVSTAPVPAPEKGRALVYADPREPAGPPGRANPAGRTAASPSRGSLIDLLV